MTDNEIIHIWSLCQLEDSKVCETCPLGQSYPWCDEVLQKETIDLINHQNAEIEHLKIIRNEKAFFLAEDIKNKVKAEAIKDFAERLKHVFWSKAECDILIREVVDNLVKEMSGETIAQKAKDQPDFCGVPCNFAEELANTSRAKAIRDFVYELKQIPHIAVYKYEIDIVAKEMEKE